MPNTPLLPLLKRLVENDPATAARMLQSLDEQARGAPRTTEPYPESGEDR